MLQLFSFNFFVEHGINSCQDKSLENQPFTDLFIERGTSFCIPVYRQFLTLKTNLGTFEVKKNIYAYP